MERTSVKRRNCSNVELLSVPCLATLPPSDSVRTRSSEPITNAFFIDVSSAPLAQPLLRILGPAPIAYLEIEPGARRRAGISDRPDALPLANRVPLLHVDLRDMRVEREQLVPVIHDDEVSVTLEPACKCDLPGQHGLDARALGRLYVNTVAERTGPEPRMHLRAERGGDLPRGRPGQAAPEGRRGDSTRSTRRGGRWRRRSRGLGRRCPGLSLPGLELPDERLQAL